MRLIISTSCSMIIAQDGDSALKMAVLQHHELVLELLMLRKVDLEKVDQVMYSSIARLLLSKIDFTAAFRQNGCGALYHAVQYGHFHSVVQLIAGGANVNAVTGEVCHYECCYNLSCLQFTSYVAQLRKSVLQAAVLCGHTDIVRYLVDNGASLDYADKVQLVCKFSST